MVHVRLSVMSSRASQSKVIFFALTDMSTSLKCAPYSLLSFFLTCVPKLVSACGASAPASLSTFASSAVPLSCTVKNVCARPVDPARPVSSDAVPAILRGEREGVVDDVLDYP